MGQVRESPTIITIHYKDIQGNRNAVNILLRSPNQLQDTINPIPWNTILFWAGGPHPTFLFGDLKNSPF
nr:hypothetical protein Q903MT_gene2868 [Picea sitchensis]